LIILGVNVDIGRKPTTMMLRQSTWRYAQTDAMRLSVKPGRIVDILLGMYSTDQELQARVKSKLKAVQKEAQP